MYPNYERYWLAVLANPAGVLPFSGREPTKNEISYARLADKIPHLVVSRTLDKVAWKTTRIVRDLEEIRKLKQGPRKAGVIDEIQLMVNPLVLGGGKALFKDVKERQALKLGRAKPLKSGKVALTYSTQS
jgi:RibD C-terminal domain